MGRVWPWAPWNGAASRAANTIRRGVSQRVMAKDISLSRRRGEKSLFACWTKCRSSSPFCGVSRDFEGVRRRGAGRDEIASTMPRGPGSRRSAVRPAGFGVDGKSFEQNSQRTRRTRRTQRNSLKKEGPAAGCSACPSVFSVAFVFSVRSVPSHYHSDSLSYLNRMPLGAIAPLVGTNGLSFGGVMFDPRLANHSSRSIR